jgi:hypothetical protein
MKFVWCLLIAALSSSNSFAESLYTDTWVNWTPVGKEYNVVCFTKRNVDLILKGVRILRLNRKAFNYQDVDGETRARPSKNCFFEQLDPHPVSRDELFEEIVTVKCSMNQIPFKDGDFRVLGTNASITSVKKLRDGKIWVLPTHDCTFTTQLPKKPMMPVPGYIPEQPQIGLSPEFSMFPGQVDQPKTIEPKAPETAKEKPPKVVAPLTPEQPDESALPVPKKVEVKPSPEPTPVEPPSENPNGTIKNLINTLG